MDSQFNPKPTFALLLKLNAIGLSVLWPMIEINSTGDFIPCELPLSTAVVPFVGKDVVYFKSADQNTAAEDLNFSSYPNPGNGLINLEANKITAGTITAELVNTLDQLVYRLEFPEGEQFQLQFPSNIPTGHYFLNINQEDKMPESKRIHLIC